MSAALQTSLFLLTTGLANLPQTCHPTAWWLATNSQFFTVVPTWQCCLNVNIEDRYSNQQTLQIIRAFTMQKY
jgi:hypothetical protein